MKDRDGAIEDTAFERVEILSRETRRSEILSRKRKDETLNDDLF